MTEQKIKIYIKKTSKNNKNKRKIISFNLDDFFTKKSISHTIK